MYIVILLVTLLMLGRRIEFELILLLILLVRLALG